MFTFVTFSILWGQVDMDMSVRFRQGKGKKVKKYKRDNGA